MTQLRVKFYGKNDMSASINLQRMKVIVDKFLDNSLFLENVEDAIEIQNIIKYISSEVYLLEWSTSYVEKLNKIKPELEKLVSNYFGTITESKCLKAMESIAFEYREDYFEIFSKYKLGEKTTEKAFMAKFNEAKIPIRYLLRTKYYINNYPNSIKIKLLSDSLYVELLLSNYTDSLRELINFPGNISVEEWNGLLDEYIEHPSANPNYLSMLEMPIKNFNKKKYFTVTPKQKNRIAKRNKNNINLKSNSDSGVVISSFVYLDKEKYLKAIKETKNELSPKDAIDKSMINNLIAAVGSSEQKKYTCSIIELIDKKEIEQNHSYTDFLNYFKYQFNFFSKRMISVFPSYPNKEMGIISRTMGVKTTNHYESGIYFNMKNQIGVMKIQAISSIIEKWGIRLEDIIFWYFSEYCNEQYNIKWVHFNLPHKDESIDNKTSTIFRIEESIRTQLSILITDGIIERDLVNVTPTPQINSLNSLFIKKYVSLSDNKTTQGIVNMLFNDQAAMGYINTQKSKNTLFELISSHKIKFIEFNEHQKNNILFLIKNEILKEREGYLEFNDKIKTNILYELYHEGSISFIHCSEEEKKIINYLEKKEVILFTNTFFSKEEADYLNFLLNNKYFDNSLAIRNEYQHGTPSYERKEQYGFDNSISLLVLIMYIVKIDEELNFLNSKKYL